MSNLKKIYDDNEATFYNYNNGKKVQTSVRKSLEIGISLLISFLYFDFSTEFINGIVCVYAILAGFGLNILFFLMGTDTWIEPKTEFSIEKNLKIGKVNTLSKELFYNISYFIAVCVVLILLCLSFYLFDSINKWFLGVSINEIVKFNHITGENLHGANLVFKYIYRFLIVLMLSESIYTFARTIFRVCFYFDKRLDVQDVHKGD